MTTPNEIDEQREQNREFFKVHYRDMANYINENYIKKSEAIPKKVLAEKLKHAYLNLMTIRIDGLVKNKSEQDKIKRDIQQRQDEIALIYSSLLDVSYNKAIELLGEDEK